MFRGAARGIFRSPRAILRASKRKNAQQRSFNSIMLEEGAIGGKQRNAFGRSTSDTLAKALSLAVCNLDAQHPVVSLQSLVEHLVEDDDGR